MEIASLRDVCSDTTFIVVVLKNIIYYFLFVEMYKKLTLKFTFCYLISRLLYFGSIRIYILMTGVVSNETNTYVRMYIEEFILVDIWIHWS